MKIIKKLKWVLLVILIGVVGALLNENYIHFSISKSIFYSILVSGITLSIVARFIAPLRKYKAHCYLISLTIGLLLVPYLSLVVGYSDIFAKDQAGTQVKEVRFKIVKIEFKKEGEDVWETNLANKEATLYPGKNWVWLGRQELSPVNYNRERGVMEAEADVVWDMNIISQEHPDWQVPTPGNNPEVIKSEDLGEGKYLVTSFHREEFDRPILRPTDQPAGEPPPPIEIYPDVGMEIIIDENGRITGIALHILLPEPLGEKIVEVPTGKL